MSSSITATVCYGAHLIDDFDNFSMEIDRKLEFIIHGYDGYCPSMLAIKESIKFVEPGQVERLELIVKPDWGIKLKQFFNKFPEFEDKDYGPNWYLVCGQF